MTKNKLDDLDCHVASRLISDSLDGAEGEEDQQRVRKHFVISATCRNVSDQMSFLRRAIRGMDSETTH